MIYQTNLKLAAVASTSLLCFSSALKAATFSISGASFTQMSNGVGTLPIGSIVQAGYFLGVSSSTSPEDFTAADWNTFTAIGGLGSDNPSQTAETTNFGWQASFTFDTEADPAQNLPASYGLRLGYRVFDSTTTTAGSPFNTVAKNLPTWVLLDPTGDPQPTDPVMNIGASGDNDGFWQFSSSAFQTVAIPEPSTTLSLLIGAGFLFGSRRRN